MKRLTYDEILYIAGARKRSFSIKKISSVLNRDETVIRRELNRNRLSYEDSSLSSEEQATAAYWQRYARRSKASSRPRLKDEKIVEYVESKLKEYWSPEEISGRMKLDKLGYSISHEAIYQWIYEDRAELKEYLFQSRKKRGKRKSGKQRRKLKKAAAAKRNISERPKEANDREEIGHLETDTMTSRKSKAALMNTVDRRTRLIMLNKVPNLESKTCSTILVKRLKSDVPPEVLKSETFDNGSENADFLTVEKELKIDTFFCNPYCASERGTVENRNGFLRKFFPKGTDFKNIPDDYIKYVEDIHNNRPMKIHGFLTPREVWNQELKMKKIEAPSPLIQNLAAPPT